MRFTRLGCGSILDTETKTEWLVGPVLPSGETGTWLFNLEQCSRGWNSPTTAQLAVLRLAADGRGLPEAFVGADPHARVWTDSSEVLRRGDTYLGENPGVYDFGTGRVAILRGAANRPMQALATRPYFTEADRRATPPAFSDFPATRRYAGRAAAVRLAGPDERMFRTRLREIGAGPVAFAGDYAFGCFGAGTSNLVCAAVSKRTGTVVWAPGAIYHGMNAAGYDDPNFEPVEYRADSRLLILRGMVNETYPNGDHYYELRDGAFHLIRTIPTPLHDW